MLNLGSFNIASILIYILSSLLVIFITMPIHEWAHGYVAFKLGDPTPKFQGRLSLNPFRHIDYMGALFILLFGFGYAKPVQVNTRYFKNEKAGMAITALAGPAANLVVAFASLIVCRALYIPALSYEFFSWMILLFNYIASINIGLAVFNLIPIPPLDGSRLLTAFLPDRIYYKLMRYERYLIIIVFLLVWKGFLSAPLMILRQGIFNGFFSIINSVFSLFGI